MGSTDDGLRLGDLVAALPPPGACTVWFSGWPGGSIRLSR